jgi:hypothetical protein
MKRFEFDYTIDDYKERLNRVSQYVNELTMEEYEELQSKTEYVEKIGEYVLFAYDKEIKKQRDSLTPAQHRVLKGKAKGINTNVDNRRQRTKYKQEKIPMSEENVERIWKCKDDIELILNQIKVYKKMLENPNLNSKQKETIYQDIADCKKGLEICEVRSQDNVNFSYDRLKDSFQTYTADIVKASLRSYVDLKAAEPYTVAHCMYMDLERAMSKCDFTPNQRIALTDYMNGISKDVIQTNDLEFAIKKILKKLK